MSRPDRTRPTDSIFIRVLIFVAVVSVFMTSVLTVNAIRSSQKTTTQTALRLGGEITDLLAQQAAGALKFRKAEDVQAVLDTALGKLKGQASAGLGVAADGTVMGAVPAETADGGRSRSMGERAIADNAPVVDRDTLVFAAPARFGNADTASGAIVIHWDTATLKAEIARQTRSAVVVGGLILILQMAVLGYVLRRMIARPLNTIAAAMATVADGNYDTEIPHFRRGNEVGVVARALESFRDKLKASDGAAKMAAFKAAGLENTTKAVMIADGDLNVSYVNPAYMRLVKEHISHLRGRLPQFDPDTIIGTSIDIFHAHPEKTRKFLENLDGAYEAEIEFGPLLFGLSISPINDSENRRIGYVTEWAYVSEERRNAAVLETFENRQAMAEFAADGTLVSANEIVAKLAGRPAANLHGTPLSALVCDVEGQPLRSVDDAVFGDFQITSQGGAAGHVTGGLTPIRTRAGEITKIILIGADVTAQRRELQAAAAQQARMQADQDRMIEALRDGLARLSDGDLMVRLETPFSGDHDRLRHDFNGALGRLNETISAVSSHSTAIRRDVGDITDAANNLSRRTEHQAATLEETAAALSELTVSVNSAAEGARKANSVVTEARTNAEKSGVVVRDAVEAMGAIAESSSKISNIISVIDDIAFQTNLLALNAGVEAARAGDAGRGFAVVASEVRALAQRSSDAAREINALISASGEHVTRGVTLVGDAGEALKQIVSSVSVISDHVSTIASSAAEQSGGLVEINEAMGQLDQVTQQNAAMFEETTAAAQALSSAADELSGAVAHFHVRPSELGAPRPAPVQAPLATGTADSTPQRTEVDLDGDWAEF